MSLRVINPQAPGQVLFRKLGSVIGNILASGVLLAIVYGFALLVSAAA
jgi:hypothetical protein